MACHLLYFIRQSKKSMKNKMIIVCVLLGLVLPLDGQTTLDDCIHYAWKHNLEFKNTQIEVQEAHTDYVAAMGKFMPDRKSTRLNSSHNNQYRMPSSA